MVTTTGNLRSALTATGVFAFYGLARYADGLIRIFLRQPTGEAFVTALARNWRTPEAVGKMLWAVALGLSLWLAVVVAWAWWSSRPKSESAPWVGRLFAPLLISVVLTGMACLSLMVSPRFPYGLNLALSLAYEGVFAQLLAWSLVGACLVHGFVQFRGPLPRRYLSDRRARRWRQAGGWIVVVTATLIFAWVTPRWFWEDGRAQGNMFKYVRMASALAYSGTLDIRQAEGAAENASFIGFASHLPRMARSSLREVVVLVRRVLGGAREGNLYLGSLRARRANRSMYRSHRGGIHYINAPGPGLLLVPAYLLDRTLNRVLGWKRQCALILFWNLLGALLVLEMIRLARPVVGNWSAAVVAAAALAASPPLWLYTFQIYPELPAALGLVYGFRTLLMEETPTRRGTLVAALALAFLPWLHQKYSIVAAAMGLMALLRLLRAGRPGLLGRLLLLGAPLALSAGSILVYNHALTGSVLPDATFRVVGRTSFEPQHMLRGLLGLLFDVENGLFVYAPVYVVPLISLRWLTRHHSRLHTAVVLVVVSYVVVIASFPYWPGAVSSVARYILSVAPFAVILLALVVRHSYSDGLLAGVAVTLFAASLSMSVSFYRDIVHSYQPALFLSRTLFCDPYQYLPSFVSEGPLGSGPAHYSKLAALLVGVTAFIWWLSRRMEREPVLFERDVKLYPRRGLLGAVGVVGFLVLFGAVLEHLPWNPTRKTGPEYRRTRALRPGSAIELSVEGRFGFERQGVWVPGGGRTRFLISSPRPLVGVRFTLVNIPRQNRVEIAQRAARPVDVSLGPSQRLSRALLLKRPYEFHGPEGDRYVYELTVHSGSGFVPSKEVGGEDSRRLGCYVVLK